MKRITPADSITLAESGRREATAQLEIMTALARLNSDDAAQRVIRAIGLILEADRLVPGILERISATAPQGRQEPHEHFDS